MDYAIVSKKLGCFYHKDKTEFRVWSPLKENIILHLYKDANTIQRDAFLMEKNHEGIHELTLEGDLESQFYTYLVDGNVEVTDPYSRASSINSQRSAIIDMTLSNPKGWLQHKLPEETHPVDSIIYEMHIKDFTYDHRSGVENKGKFLGVIEKGTKFKDVATSIDHLLDLGITHVHLLPVYDFLTVKEDLEYFSVDVNYNWGYDPELYNVVEGSYSSNPELPVNRIIELKEMIMGLHEVGIKVVIDVVYNHTYRGGTSNFEVLMPGYYYRMDENGNFSNGSGCGNELASERNMVRQFIFDSVMYWATEFKVDGFRFDLMALTDRTSIKMIVDGLNAYRPGILVYGEPWTGGYTTLPELEMTRKGSQTDLGVAFFNDGFRDAIKGDNNGIGRGFVQGNGKFKRQTQVGITASLHYADLMIGFTRNPKETINYINAHDDLIIYDKFKRSNPTMNEFDLERMNKLAFGILFTSQGIPFIHSGNEFLRTKYMIPNTYNKPASINNLDWSLKKKNINFYNYFKDLVALRNEYPELRLRETKEIEEKIKIIDNWHDDLAITYTISKDEDRFLLVIHNANHHDVKLYKSSIFTHLENNYESLKEKLVVHRIFTADGMIREDNKIYEFEKIIIGHRSTEVYELHFEDVGLSNNVQV